MSKVLKAAADVLGTAVGAAIGTIVLGPGIGTAIGATIGHLATAAATGTLLPKVPKPSLSGNAESFTANKDQGLPLVAGRTAVAGWIIHRQTYDASGSSNNAYQTIYGVWSAGGPINSIEAFQVDETTVTFSGGAAVGSFADYMWLATQLGASPESAAIQATSFTPYPVGWSAASKLSGYAAFAWTLKWDTKGKKYPSGVPQPRAILKGAKVWDPRADSTYPGGSGSQRVDDQTTWTWSENPALLALQWARGYFQNGKRVIGIGMAMAAIDTPAFVQAANVADANGWTCGGVVYSTDGKWDVMKKYMAACSGQPLQLGGLMSCEVDTPRVSLATITDADIIGDASVVGTPTISDRINGVIPSCRLEGSDWSIVPCALVQEADYVTVDGRTRTKAITWELVQDAAQVAQLAAYAITNAREFGPIVTPLKLRWIGYKPGDGLTIDSDMLGQTNQPVVIQKRHLDPASSGVTLTMRSETTGKHAFALGQTASPPPTPSLQVIDRSTLPVPGVDATGIGRGAHTILSPDPAYQISSTNSSISIASFDAALDDGTTTTFPAGTITGLSADTVYQVFRDLGANTYFAAAAPAIAAMASSNNANLGAFATQTTSGTYTPPSTPPPGSRGGRYVEP